MLVSSLLFNVGVGNGAGRREDRSGKMNRRDSRYGFETRLLIRSLGRRGDLYLLCLPRRSRGEGGSLIPSAPFTRLRAGFGAAGDIALMTKQVASWCETVGSGPVCDE